jgi:prepilin-type N-terminal cleavage/methylation domain-containing protein
MGNKKSRQGFTLVEAIVVSVIVAILAAVAIPIYTAYLNNTRQETVDQLAQTAAAAASGFYRKTGTDPADPKADLNLYYDDSRFSVTFNGPDITVVLLKDASFTSTASFR